MVLPSFIDHGPKLRVLIRAIGDWSEMAKIRPGGRKTARQMATYRKTEVIQSYLRIWGTYDPIESGPSDPKKWGLYRRSVKKCRFSGQNRAPAAAPRPAVQRDQHKNVVFLLSGHDGNKIVGRFWQKNGSLIVRSSQLKKPLISLITSWKWSIFYFVHRNISHTRSVPFSIIELTESKHHFHCCSWVSINSKNWVFEWVFLK